MPRKLDGFVAVIIAMIGICSGEVDAANATRVELTVRESHGIRRFGYPVSAELELNPPAPAQSRFRLLHNGTPVVAQFRPVGPAGDGIARIALDFDTNFMPFESRGYVVEYGREVSAGPEPERGMAVEQSGDSFVVSNGSALVWTIPKDLAGMLRSVKTPKLEYLRPDSAGLSMRLKDGATIRLGDSTKWSGKGIVTKSGPIDCQLQFQFSDSTDDIACTVGLGFPRSKSWVRVTWTVDDPQDRVAELSADLNLQLGDGPTLADFGADDLVYAEVPAGQVAVFEATAGGADATSRATSPSWRIRRGPVGQLEPYATGQAGVPAPLRGWAHAMDRQRCTAVALADCARDASDRIEVGADGHLQVSRQPGPTGDGGRARQKRLDYWVHFVPFPPHVGAVTSPQSMQSPIVVQFQGDSAPATQAARQTPADDTVPIGSAPSKAFVNLESLQSRAKAALSKTAGEISLAGLLDRVEVLRDKWGVPHIYAQNDDDLFFAQGFVQAQDRLWQMDIWRRTTEGKLAEIVGADGIERDRFARLIEYRGDIDAEWASYGPDSRRIIESFVRGVNACIELSGDNLPIEFQLAGLRPEPWTPRVCIGRMAGFIMCRNAATEVLRAQLVREIGASAAAQLIPLDPIHDIKVPDGLDLAGIDQRVLTGMNAVNAAIKVPLAGADSNHAALLDGPIDRWSDDSALVGSNNWVISGRLTNTGKPILANDPHRPITLPSLRYLVHLNCPRAAGASEPPGRAWNVIGGTEPALPGVAIGHNEHIAWGMTIVGTDQSDIYVEETQPDDPNRYRVGDRWEPMEIERQQIGVRGEAQPRAIELKFTRHGPVIWEDAERHRAYVLRWTGREPGTAGYMGALALDRASNWTEFVEAAGRWKVPSENLVYADVDGNIGWIAAALTPIRPAWDGLLPVPGSSGKYEWSGFLTASQLPAQFNPGQGYIATANHNILPQGYSHHISFEWAAPYRFQRIDQVFRDQIQRQQKFTIGQSQAMQHDAASLAANRLLDMLAETTNRPPELAPSIELLLSWRTTAVLQEDSAAAALFGVWQKMLVDRVLKTRLPDKLWERYSNRMPTQAMLDLLADPNSDFGRNSHQRRDNELLQSLAAATAELEKLLGPNRSAWRWGTLHQAHFRHMLGTPWKPADLQKANNRTASRTTDSTAAANSTDSAAVVVDPVNRDDGTSGRSAISSLLDLRSVPRAGDANSPIATGGPNYQQTTGASYRQIIDFADWDRSVATSVPGQSGQPMSPHYGDLLPLWEEGKYFPLLFSRAAVEANCAQKLVLSPARAK
jgi:penicillin amidase